jgi:hypothetical protein
MREILTPPLRAASDDFAPALREFCESVRNEG